MESADKLKQYARVWGSPGESARTVGMLRTFWPVLGLMALTGYVVGVALPPVKNPPMAWSGAALLVIAAASVWVVKRCRDGYALFLQGAHGEEHVARVLGFLPAEYYVFHSVQLQRSTGRGAGDFDHVVVGPNGVFVIETKNWRGKIEVVDGKILVDEEPASFAPLEQVKASGEMLSAWVHDRDKILPEVHHVLCFVGSGLRRPARQVDGVAVCDEDGLFQLLTEGVKSGVGLDGVLTRVLHALQAQVRQDDE